MLGAGVSHRPEDLGPRKTRGQKLFEEGAALLRTADSSKPRGLAPAVSVRQRRFENNLGRPDRPARSHHPGELAKKVVPTRVEVEDSVDEHEIDTPRLQRQVFASRDDYVQVFRARIHDRPSGLEGHFWAEINTHHPSMRANAPRSDDGVQTRTAPQIEDRRGLADIGEDGNAGHPRE